MKHECEKSRTCKCYLLADEPNEKCPVHGAFEWPPRCGECGKFLPWSEEEWIERIEQSPTT